MLRLGKRQENLSLFPSFLFFFLFIQPRGVLCAVGPGGEYPFFFPWISAIAVATMDMQLRLSAIWNEV